MPKLIRGTDRKTLRRFGGKLQTTNCRSRCCAGGGDCATIQRYDRCAPTPETEGCQSNPDHLWLCMYPNAPFPTPMPETVKEGNSCYSKTDTIIPTAQIPVGDVLLTSYTNRPLGCADPECTACLHFYKAEPCPGQDMTGLPPVFMLTQDVPAIPPGKPCPLVSANNRCYTIQPGQVYLQSEVIAAGGVVLTDPISPNYIPLLCCDCVSGCEVLSVPTYFDCGLGEREINLRCCCSDDWTATVALTWTETTSGTAPNGDVTVFTRTAAGTVMIRSTDAPGTPYTVRVHETATKNGNPDPSVLTQDHDMGVPFAGACVPGPIEWRGEFGTGFCPAGGPRVIQSGFPGTYQEVVRADSFLTCNTFTSSYHYRTFEAGELRINNVATYSVTVRHTGRCGGGCGQATGQVQNAAGAVLAKQQAKAVPHDKWPLWARAVELGRATEDKGVGDTIKRTLGGAGEAFEAWYLRVVGKDCGCRDRAAHLSALYPYPKAV